MELRSDAFQRDQQIPLKYTKDGENISPPLSWTAVPGQTRELALVFETITPQTREPMAQWLLYKIPPNIDHLPEGFKHQRDPKEPLDVLQGTNDLGNVGYDGPVGTAGRTMRFRFKLFALDEQLDVPPKLSKGDLLKTIADHCLDETELLCTYERPPAE